MNQLLKKLLAKGIAAALLLTLYSLTRLPSLSQKEKQELAQQFRFAESSLFEPAGLHPAFVRTVHPQYEKISAWISSVGAACYPYRF